MKAQMKPNDNVLWYLKRSAVPVLRESIDVDVVIVGGGMAGLSAAQAWALRGKKVALLEQYFCGAGASGKSSGFITPNAELSCADFVGRYGQQGAKNIWALINGGVDLIRNNIEHHDLSCRYSPEDTLVVANNSRGLKGLVKEYEAISQFGYPAKLYDQQSVQQMIGSAGYMGGVLYENTFGIDAYAYCQGMKQKLQDLGVLIFEETPVTSIQEHEVRTPYGQVRADYIVVSVDRYLPDMGLFKDDVFQVQTYVMASQQLTPEQIKTIFPDRNLMCWDTQFIYNYFRLTADNRLLLGGSDFFSTYSYVDNYAYMRIVKKLTDYFNAQFPTMNLQFEYRWSGLIGISKDIAPLIGVDKQYPYRFYIASCAGLPIAAAMGRYSAARLLDGVDEFERYFSIYRNFPVGGLVQKVIGKRMAFALSNLLKMNIP
ncbi:FAD-binding oxidoreductase [Candidatus Babeliales bacterium]|nr:FAD-binding oxidoreductase [Candidatus Babeliales bacterium]